MGEEAFDEDILVADSGTVIVRGGFGRERVFLGLSNGRDEDGSGDVVIELTERQRQGLGRLLGTFVEAAALNRLEELAELADRALETGWNYLGDLTEKCADEADAGGPLHCNDFMTAMERLREAVDDFRASEIKRP